MTLEETVKYLKKGKITLYKTAREGKIPGVRIEFGRDDKVRFYVPYEQKLIKKEGRCSKKK